MSPLRSRPGRHPGADDLVGYSIGALDPGQERAVAEHLSGCSRCAAELRSLAPAVGVLAESVEQLEPPDSLRQSLMATVHSEAGRAPAAKPEPRRGRVRGFLWRPVAALGAVALVAAGAVGYLMHDSGGDSDRTQVAMRSEIPGAGGAIEVEGDAATLEAHGMPRLARGEVYQVWVARGDRITPSAAFVPHADGSATAAVPEVAGGEVSQVMVTEEPRAGRTKPHLPSLLNAKLD